RPPTSANTIERNRIIRSAENLDELALGRREHPRAVLLENHVDLGPHTEFGKINSRLDREAEAGHQWPRVMGLEIVEVRAIPVLGVGSDIVTGAVHEEVAEAACGDEIA